MSPALVNESELYFERGGLAYRLAQRLGHKLGIGHSYTMRILGFLAITWFPLLFFSVIEGRALGATPRDSLLLDFGTYGVLLGCAAADCCGIRRRTATARRRTAVRQWRIRRAGRLSELRLSNHARGETT